ncbi:MAG: GNAT family N-acetyltransferase [Dechloromonas sp.]|uniref:GNAT family N-acetyltransferase n=1 Tax=Candidatus Dechloromonas phosphorivorans TaxID=2899244 RepID=A0A9D7QIP3_9RHOO|nr:GNAT family N-acetyltransferase [Candidatus Dechloromonas phosphorivorans]
MFKSLKSAISSLGLSNGVLYLLGRAMQAVSGGRWFLVRYYLVAQPVPNPFVPVCRPSENDRVVEIDRQNPIVKTFPRPSAVIQNRFEKGLVCLAATSKQTFSGFLWFARGAYDEDEVHCRFVLANPDTMVWDFDVYVEPQFRLGRTFARLWDAANEQFSSSGIQWSISRISAFNQQSLQSHERLGIRRLNSLTFVCLGGLQIGFMSCSPYLNICTKDINRPVVVIDSLDPLT